MRPQVDRDAPSQGEPITAAEAAAILGCSVHTIARWVRRGKLRPTVKLAGQRGAYLFDRAEIEQLARRRRR
jgi:excisionase family DNA binding protein